MSSDDRRRDDDRRGDVERESPLERDARRERVAGQRPRTDEEFRADLEYEAELEAEADLELEAELEDEDERYAAANAARVEDRSREALQEGNGRRSFRGRPRSGDERERLRGSGREATRGREHPMGYEPGRGRTAKRPTELGKRGWLDVVKRVIRQVKEDNLALVAAGVAFYGFLALFPALAALVSIYGLIADPVQVQEQMASVSGAMPGEALTIVEGQLEAVASASDTGLSWTLVLGLLLTIWAANKGMRGLVKALNIAYDEDEKRGFIKLNAFTLLLTFGAIVSVVVAIALIAALPALLGTLNLGRGAEIAVDIARWPLLAGLVFMGLTVLYRFAPAREDAKWRWVTPGSILATVLWLIVSLAFSIYVANFGSYNETYGTLGAVAIMLIWFFLSAFVILLGAEVNGEAEHQTRRDSTTGEPKPMGQRGAYHADTLGEAQ
jgi:membrane protein